MIESLTELWQNLIDMAPRLLLAALVLLAFYLAGKYLARLVRLVLQKTTLRKVHEPFFATLILLVFMFLGAIVALDIVGFEGLAISLLAGGGVTAVVLGFAFREIGENFLAGIFLAFSSPFRIGDVIRSEDIEGKVVSIDLRNTHLRTDDGCDVFVPSSQLFNRPVINYTRDGLRRISFSVGIDYANDAKGACELLTGVLESIDRVLAEPVPGVYIQELGAQYVQLRAFFWIDVFKPNQSGKAVRTQVMDRCRVALLENGYTVSSETTSNLAVTMHPDDKYQRGNDHETD